MTSTPPLDAPPEPSGGLQRRTIVGAAAWAAPAIVLSAASPAAAASVTSDFIRMETTGLIQVKPGETVKLTGFVEPGNGRPMPDYVMVAVNDTKYLSAPSQVQVGPGGIFWFEVTGVASDGKQHLTVVTMTTPGNGYQVSPFAVLASDVGAIAITGAPGGIPQGEQRTATGTVTAPAGASLPATVTVTSSAKGVATVPATVAVASDGTFSIPVTAVASSGTATITVSASGYDSATFTATAAAATLGTIDITATPGNIPQGEQGTARGKVNPPAGKSRPSTVSVSSSATGVATVPATVTVASDGTFSIPVTAKASSGTATITVSASGYSSKTFTVAAVAAPTPSGTIAFLADEVPMDTKSEYQVTFKVDLRTGKLPAGDFFKVTYSSGFLSGPSSALGPASPDGDYTIGRITASKGSPTNKEYITVTGANFGSARLNVVIKPV